MRISNKKLFKQQIFTIISTILAIVVINVFINDLCNNGLANGFTVPSYKKAFQTTLADIKLFNLIKVIMIVFSVYAGVINMGYNKEISDIEEEKRILLGEEVRI